jgi:small-conductance mechanosensitive channel
MSEQNKAETTTPKGFLKKGRLRIKENRKRVYFILKIILFIVLIFIKKKYPVISVGGGFNIESKQIAIIAYYVLANTIVSIIRLVLVSLYIKRNNLGDGDKDNFILGVDRIASLISFFLLVVAIFLYAGIEPGEFLRNISLVAVALVLLFKDYISNLMNGMIMMFSDQFHINDHIKVGEFKGRIIDINLANVKIKSDEGELFYIPNNLVYLKEVINYSKGNSSQVLVDFDLNMKFFGQITQLEKNLTERITQQFTTHIKAEGISLKVEKIKKEEAAMKLIVNLNKQNKRLEKIVQKYCNFIIVDFIGTNLNKE